MIKVFKRLGRYWPAIIGIILSVTVMATSQLYLPTLMSDIVNNGVSKGDTSYIINTGLLMLLVAVIGSIASIITSFLSSRTGMRYSKELRQEIFEKATNYSLTEIDQIGTSSLITRTTNDVTQVQNVIVMLLRIAFRAPIMMIGGIIIANSKDYSLSYILLFAIILLGVFVALIATRAVPIFKSIQIKLDRLNLVLRERLTGIRVIRAFNKVDYEQQRFNTANEDLTDTSIKVNRIMAIVMPFITLLLNLTIVAIFWFGAIRVDSGHMMVGDVMAFIQYGMQIMFSVLMLTMIFIMVPRASASIIRINEVLDLTSEIIENPDAKDPSTSKGLLEFKNVTYKYHTDHKATEPAIENISFTLKPGEITAIIGGTGSGKSTIVNLVERFYDVSEGEIRLNNVNIKDFSFKDLRNKIGLVPQKSVIFSGSISDNIRYGKSDATLDDIKEAAMISQAKPFIEKMPESYNSEIAQGGTNISGGQKQRLAIARAIIKKPEIYIFDDSFSALDFKTDAKLRQALRDHLGDASILMVAQRVSTIMNAHQILVLDEGKIVGKGTHQSLLKDCEIYKEIVSSQLSEEEIA